MGNSASQMIASAFTFGTSALVFASLPFLFILLKGIFKANSGHNTHSSSILSVFAMAFSVHFISCLGFMLAIKTLDAFYAIYEPNYLQGKIFSIFCHQFHISVSLFHFLFLLRDLHHSLN